MNKLGKIWYQKAPWGLCWINISGREVVHR